MFFPNLWINNSICIVITARCKNIPLLHSTSVLTSLYIEDNISVNKHRFRDVVTLATYHVSASLIGNTFTLTPGANINTNKSFQPDFKSGFFALLSRFSSSLAHHSDTNLFSQSRRCEHHRQHPGGASDRSTWPPWLRCC